MKLHHWIIAMTAAAIAMTVTAGPSSSVQLLLGSMAASENYGEELTSGLDYSLRSATVYKKGLHYFDNSEKAKSAFWQALNDQHETGANVRVLLSKGDRGGHDSNVKITEKSKYVTVQNESSYQRIPIKSSYARRICKLYQRGEFDGMQDFIERRWKGRYALEDIYLSVRCYPTFNRNVDLVRTSPENSIAIRFSSIKLEYYFRQLAVENNGDSLLTKVMYCKKRYNYGLHDFFEFLDYEEEQSRKRDDVWRADHISRLRQIMSGPRS